MKMVHGPVHEARLHALVEAIRPNLRAGDRVLDVGCGDGVLGQMLMTDAGRPQGVAVEGLELSPRGHEPIPVVGYDGKRFPFPDRSYDLVMLADVLHHDPEPDRLMAECVRVARRWVVVKDHLVKGVLANSRICLMDWLANAPFGIPCTYKYLSHAQWKAFAGRHGVSVVSERTSMRQFPAWLEWFFGGSLHYFAVYDVNANGRGGPHAG